MSAYLITGASGSGKSTLAHYLANEGYDAINLDRYDEVYNWVDDEGNPAPYLDERNPTWVAKHRRVWDDYRMREMVKAIQSKESVFVCGSADNQNDYYEIFDRVFALMITPGELLRRVNRDRRNRFRREYNAQRYFAERLEVRQQRLTEKGAIPIDGSREPQAIIDEIMTHLEIEG